MTVSTLTGALSQSRCPDAVFTFYRGNPVSFRQFRNAVGVLCGRLSESPEQRYALCFDELYPFTVALCACLCAGKIPVLPGHNLKPLLKEQTDRFDAVMALCDLKIPGRPAYLIADSDLLEAEDYQDNLTADSTALIILYTSGSTGNAKQIEKPLYCMEKEAVVLQNHFKDRTKGLTQYATVYPYHMYGLTFRVFYPLFAGVVTDSGITHYTEELAVKKGPLMLISSPAFLKRLDSRLNAPDIKVTVSAGGRLPPDAALSYHEWVHGPVDEIYGSTETGVAAVKANCGTDVPFVLFDGMSLKDAGNGAYCLKSPLLPDGSMLLDDRLSFTDERSFIVLGRRDRVIKIEEKRISIDEIEKRLMETGLFKEAAAVPIDKAGRTVIGLAAVLKNPDLVLSRREKLLLQQKIKSALTGKIEPAGIPKTFRFVGEIPVNHMGKRVLSSLVELFDAKA